ncbi:hypothetical protein FNJ87_13325 [Nonlabens mediterrranea]|uniref:Uncharacterized protein n=1 Tax=Nonlabens mediterrranea TaxID=1419947 RepID=A0ABS0A8R4_9FLAO|nr:hypothetical protein BBFL7_00253 [Flavobacteria bacterium BBFL7]MBF4985269.1 hypothetical protein [Nonlabens mediterrranea]
MIDRIPCIKCHTLIAVDTERYIKGEKFACGNCDNVLGIDVSTDLDTAQLQKLKLFSKNNRSNSTMIPCPDCGSIIQFNTKDLSKGKSMSCPACKANVSLQS